MHRRTERRLGGQCVRCLVVLAMSAFLAGPGAAAPARGAITICTAHGVRLKLSDKDPAPEKRWSAACHGPCMMSRKGKMLRRA